MALDLIEVSRKLQSGEVSPFELDLSEIQQLSKMIPASGVIDLNVAEELATQFIRAADLCVELQAAAMMYEGRAISKKKQKWAMAMYDKAKAAGMKTSKEKESFADADEEYLKATVLAVDAIAFRKWLENKYDVFIKAHHLSKNVYEASKRQEPFGKRVVDAGIFEEKETTGEESW